MRDVFKFVFWSSIIIFSGASFLHTDVGTRFIGRFFRYSGLAKTEKKASSNRVGSQAVRVKASELSAAANEKLEALGDIPSQDTGIQSARMNKAAEEIFHNKLEALRDKQERFRDRQKGVSVEREDNQAIGDKIEAVRQKLEIAQEQAQAQRERAMAQKALMEEKAAR